MAKPKYHPGQRVMMAHKDKVPFERYYFVVGREKRIMHGTGRRLWPWLCMATITLFLAGVLCIWAFKQTALGGLVKPDDMVHIKINMPSPGESISEVRIAQWLVKDGDLVTKDQPIAEVDTDKATLELSAHADGRIELLVNAGSTINVGDTVARILMD